MLTGQAAGRKYNVKVRSQRMRCAALRCNAARIRYGRTTRRETVGRGYVVGVSASR